MELLGNAFINLRNCYIIPLVQYGIQRNKVKYWSFKSIITNNIISLNSVSKNTIELEISEDDFYKASLCDIELFKNKSIIQYVEYSSIKNKKSTWAFVSLYYHFFFTATTLMRMLHRGFIYLDSTHVKSIENYSLAMYSNPIRLDSGNFYYSVKGKSITGNVIILLSNKGEGIHQLTWLQMEAILHQEIIPNASNDESLLYSQLLTIINSLDSRFPSVLRNKLNYPSESSLLDLEKILPEIKIDLVSKNFYKSFLDIKPNDNSIENQILITSCYSMLIFNLVQNLYQEYETRSKFHKDFQKERRDFLNEYKVELIEL